LPVAFYCLVLAAINRRTTPLLVNGGWDMVGLMFAASGFFLVTIPMLLNRFYERTISELGGEPFLELWFRHWLVWLLYYLLIISGGAFLILWRGQKTMIYNIDPELFVPALESAFAPLGLEVQTQHHRIVIVPAVKTESEGTGIVEGLPVPSRALPKDNRHAEFDYDSFPALCHVTLHWRQTSPQFRQDVEKELQKALSGATPQDNPATAWFLCVSGLVFGMMLVVVVTLGVLLVLRWRG
jgi:hypothetical protein